MLSYQVEQYFYTYFAPQLPPNIAVAKCVTSINKISNNMNTTAMVMTDLRQEFPVAGEKRGTLNRVQSQAALTWLADFHGFWWTRSARIDKDSCILPPLQHYKHHASTSFAGQGGLWCQGGYTYLDTRRTEYDSLKNDSDQEWSSQLCSPTSSSGLSIAELAARFITSSSASPYQTLIHGDVKSENLFTTKSGDRVAFYDFQYVGFGLGVSDLAKLFTCSIPLSSLVDDISIVYGEAKLTMQKGEQRLLECYLERLMRTSGKQYIWDVFVRHWEVALVDWLRFQASWGFWGNSEWLEARVRSILEDEEWLKWLIECAGTDQVD